jgi:hypothetical protein
VCWRQVHQWPFGEDGRVWGFNQAGNGLFVTSSLGKYVCSHVAGAREDGRCTNCVCQACCTGLKVLMSFHRHCDSSCQCGSWRAHPTNFPYLPTGIPSSAAHQHHTHPDFVLGIVTKCTS